MRRGSLMVPSRARSALLLLWLCLAAVAFADAAPLRFAWLSDTHVGASTGADDLKAAVLDINAMKGLSFVIVSGDVTEYGSRGQLELAKGLLDDLRIPYHVIPGNHDTKWSESGGTDFPKLFHGDRFVFDAGGWRFIGLHQGPVMRMGDGHWAPQDVAWLEDVLAKADAQRLPVVFVTHYPVNNSIANWFVVLDQLKKHGTRVILCGHGHSNRAMSFEGLPGVMGRSDLRARSKIGGFNLVEIENGRMAFSERLTGQETKPPWHTVDLLAPSAFEEGARPDFSVNADYPGVIERWVWASGWTIASAAAVWRHSGIVGDASGTVTALSLASGKPEWRFRTGGPVYGAPDVSGDRVAVASTDGNVYALDARTGAALWRFKTRRPLVGSPAVAGGVVYVGSSEGKFWALDLASGKRLWTFAGLGGFVEARPLMYDGKLVFGAWDQHLYALDAVSGRQCWTWTGDRAGVLYSPAACWPIAAGGKVFVVAPDRQATALDAKTGAVVWRSGDFEGRESIGIAEDGSRVYIRAMNNKFYALSSQAGGPEKLWELNAGFGYDINSAMLVEKDGVVFYGTKNGLLLAMDGPTGKLRWRHKTGVALLNTVTPLNGRQLLVTDFDGRVTLIEALTGK